VKNSLFSNEHYNLWEFPFHFRPSGAEGDAELGCAGEWEQTEPCNVTTAALALALAAEEEDCPPKSGEEQQLHTADGEEEKEMRWGKVRQ
jgi:hypothetical protein